MAEFQKVYSAGEFAMLVKLHPDTVRQYCRSGTIRAKQVTPGGPWRIPESEVERFTFRRTD